MSQIQSARSQVEQRAIKLLGNGTPASVVAQAVGVSESRISQLMADESFATEVNELKFVNLNKHNEQDAKLDQMEAQLTDMMKEQLPLLMRPNDILRAMQVINKMERRGASAPEQIHSHNQVVNLLMPNVIVQKFQTNVNNQVIVANGQTLETIQGSTLLAAAKAKQGLLSHELPTYVRTEEVSSAGSREERPQLAER